VAAAVATASRVTAGNSSPSSPARHSCIRRLTSIPYESNIWIIYPVLGLGLILGIDAWSTFGREPITEREIRREMDRLTGAR
jgi:hypothetical protein